MAVDVTKVDSVDVAVYVFVGVERCERVLRCRSACFCNRSDGDAVCRLCSAGSARTASFFPQAPADLV